MQLVEYIYNPNNGGYGIDLGYIPTTTTWVRIKGKAVDDGWLYFGIGPDDIYSNGYFRLFAYQSGYLTVDCPHDSNARLDIPIDSSAEYFDISLGFSGSNPDFFISNPDESFYQAQDMSSFASVFDFGGTLKCWGNPNYSVYAGSRFYEIWIYEGPTLEKHFVAAVDVNSGAGLYETIDQEFYGAMAGSNTIDYHALPSIEVSGRSGRISVPASGTSISGSVEVRADLAQMGLYWEIAELSSVDSANTISIDGQTGLHYYSGSTTGTYQYSITIPNWDGTGAASSANTKNTYYSISVRNATGGTETMGNTPFTFQTRQANPNPPAPTGKPMHLGDDECSVAYVGDEAVLAAYLGDDLVFEA